MADTGADISVIPLPLGQVLVSNVENGIPMHIGGVLSSDMPFNAFVHRVKTRIGDHLFEMPVAVSLLSIIPPIWGRQEALDRFTASYVQGRELVLEIRTYRFSHKDFGLCSQIKIRPQRTIVRLRIILIWRLAKIFMTKSVVLINLISK